MDRDISKRGGVRNIAVHNYGAIDWNIVHAIARHHLGDFEDFARAIGRRITDDNRSGG